MKVIRKTLLYVSMFLSGAIIGWGGHFVYSLSSNMFSISKNKTDKADTIEPIVESESYTLVSPQFFSNQKMLNNTQLGMMIELFKQDLDLEAQDELNKEVVQYAMSLLLNVKNPKNTEQRLLALLGNYDTKEQVLNVLSRFYQAQGNYQQAISSLYNLRSMAQYDEQYNQITKKINQLSKKYLKDLKAYNYKSEMADFYEFLMKKEPDNFEMQMEYAEFEFKNRNYEHVEELLSVLLYHPDFSLQAENLLQKAQHQKELIDNGIVPIPLEKKGNHYFVMALINNQEPVKLIIDTGATLTMLSPKIIRELGIRLDDAQQYMEFSTANGVVQAPVIMIDSLSVQNHVVRDVQVGVLTTLQNTQVGGLLGMNFLSQFAFYLDQKNSSLELVEVD